MHERSGLLMEVVMTMPSDGVGSCDHRAACLQLRHDAGLADADALLLHGLCAHAHVCVWEQSQHERSGQQSRLWTQLCCCFKGCMHKHTADQAGHLLERQTRKQEKRHPFEQHLQVSTHPSTCTHLVDGHTILVIHLVKLIDEAHTAN